MSIATKNIGHVSIKVKIRRALWIVVSYTLFKTCPTKIFWPCSGGSTCLRYSCGYYQRRTVGRFAGIQLRLVVRAKFRFSDGIFKEFSLKDLR